MWGLRHLEVNGNGAGGTASGREGNIRRREKAGLEEEGRQTGVDAYGCGDVG